MSAQDTERAAALERRYRRLLRCYPPGHREVHREEMVGVLLATARPGQRAPGARQTVNLVACGLAIRARRALRSLADEPWQDALAVVSLITPALMFISSWASPWRSGRPWWSIMLTRRQVRSGRPGSCLSSAGPRRR